MLIRNFCKLLASQHLVLKDSSVGLALNFLGLLTDPEMKEYISTRGGVLATYADEAAYRAASTQEEKDTHLYILTVEQMLQILPD